MKKCYLVIINLILIIIVFQSLSRSIHRPRDKHMPWIEVCYADQPNEIALCRSYSLREWSVFGRYNKEILDSMRMPEYLPYRYDPSQKASSAVLSSLIEEFIKEIFKTLIKKKNFTSFIVVKDKDFDYAQHSGLMIAKFKNYPFYVKLFIENPQGLTRPYSKSFEVGIMYGMGGCPGRFYTGFTRIPNLIKLRKKINADPYWRDKITLPNKWYWTPDKPRIIRITGHNMGEKEVLSAEYPSIYAVICEEVALEKQLRALHKSERRMVRQIIQFLGNDIDPHIKNFFIEKGTGKIAIIDTEHFASMVGLEQEIKFNGNFQWYCNLANRATYKLMWQTKKERRAQQKIGIPPILDLTTDE